MKNYILAALCRVGLIIYGVVLFPVWLVLIPIYWVWYGVMYLIAMPIGWIINDERGTNFVRQYILFRKKIKRTVRWYDGQEHVWYEYVWNYGVYDWLWSSIESMSYSIKDKFVYPQWGGEE